MQEYAQVYVSLRRLPLVPVLIDFPSVRKHHTSEEVPRSYLFLFSFRTYQYCNHLSMTIYTKTTLLSLGLNSVIYTIGKLQPCMPYPLHEIHKYLSELLNQINFPSLFIQCHIAIILFHVLFILIGKFFYNL